MDLFFYYALHMHEVKSPVDKIIYYLPHNLPQKRRFYRRKLQQEVNITKRTLFKKPFDQIVGYKSIRDYMEPKSNIPGLNWLKKQWEIYQTKELILFIIAQQTIEDLWPKPNHQNGV